MRWIAPSKISAWEGTPVEGSPFTAQQHEVMKRERPSWTHFHGLDVRLQSQPRNAWEPPEVVVVRCPIIAWSKDRTRVLIIAPAGDKIWRDAETKKGRTP